MGWPVPDRACAERTAASRRLRALVAGPLFLAALLCASRGQADDTALVAARLEHELSYLSADYAMAASSAVPGDGEESEEHVELANEVERSASSLGLTKEATAAIAQVAERVRRNAPAAEVAVAVEEARAVLIASFHLATAPARAPDLTHGRALFEQYCAPCHGLGGRADTARAAALTPRPANYVDPAIGEPLSPYRIYTTVEFGVAGTAMVPFGFLAEAERWDIAFYAMGLRHVGREGASKDLYATADLAILSDAELRADLRAAGVLESDVEPTLSGLRHHVPDPEAEPDAIEVARSALREIDAASHRGRPDLALTTTRLLERDGLHAIEPAILLLDGDFGVRVRAESRALREVLERPGSSPRALHLATVPLERSLLRARLLSQDAWGHLDATTLASRVALLLAARVAPAGLLFLILLVLARGAPRPLTRPAVGALGLGLAAAWATSSFLEGFDAADAMPAGMFVVAALASSALLLRLTVRHRLPIGRWTVRCGALALFAAAWAGALEPSRLLPSMLACGIPRGPVLVGAIAGSVAVLFVGAGLWTGSTLFSRARVGRAAVGALCLVEALLLTRAFPSVTRSTQAAPTPVIGRADAPAPGTEASASAPAPSVDAETGDAPASGRACSAEGYGPGPEPRADAGNPFQVIFDCLWPGHRRLEISVSLMGSATRAEVERLLRALWKDLQERMGEGFPETVKVCVLAPGATVSDLPLGCLRKGYEPEGEPGEEEPDLALDMRAERSDVARGLLTQLDKRRDPRLRPRITLETNSVKVTYPVAVDEGEGGAPRPAYADAVLPFFLAAWEFYPPKTDVTELVFEGTWNGETLVRIDVKDAAAFLRTEPWAVRRRLEDAHVPLSLEAPRDEAQKALIRDELRAALSKLAPRSVSVAPLLE